jgi:CheY-like chemotaxis protein
LFNGNGIKEMQSTHGNYVLVVDDDPFQVEELVEYLNDQGVAAYGESQPERAVARIEAEKPALVIIDINMPGLNGIRVTEIVRGLNYDGVILLASGDMDALRRANESHPNVFGVLPKPIPLNMLERCARAVLDRDVLRSGGMAI